MRAYLQATRDYEDAFVRGKDRDPAQQAVASMPKYP